MSYLALYHESTRSSFPQGFIIIETSSPEIIGVIGPKVKTPPVVYAMWKIPRPGHLDHEFVVDKLLRELGLTRKNKEPEPPQMPMMKVPGRR